MRRGVIIIVFACVAALATSAPAAAPLIPKSAVYTGKTSQGKVVEIFISKRGKRIGYTIHVELLCTNGATDRTYWTTQGRFYKDWWIRPKRNGTFSLKSSNEVNMESGYVLKARAQINGRFKSRRLVTGRFRGHGDWFNADGTPYTQCDTGPLTWSAKRTK